MFNSALFSSDFSLLAWSSFITYLPRLLLALAILLAGTFLAKYLRRAVSGFLSALKLSHLVEKTPMGDFLDQTGVGRRLDDIVSALVYWGFLLIVVYVAASVLGVASLVFLLEKVFDLMPAILSALVVLVIGVVLAGVVESFVKSSLKSITGRSTLVVGKIASYGVLVLTVLMVLSELGIARDFILILFIGFVATFALAVGLAVGLGSQQMVRDMLTEWYKQAKKE